MSPALDADNVEYLQGLDAVRERCHAVLNSNNLQCFTVHQEALPKTVDYVIKLIERDYGPVKNALEIAQTINRIPPHGRWRHFGNDNMAKLLNCLQVQTPNSLAESVIDLFVVAVLLDAGAGDQWKFRDPATGQILVRSEGLAVASLRMFEAGSFSSTSTLQVDATGLMAITEEMIQKGFQVSADNPLVGLSGRVELLHRLGQTLKTNLEFFPDERPGSMLYYLKRNISPDGTVEIDILWELIVRGLGGIWPEGRGKVKGVALGDAWPCAALNGHIVPFHKLSQWLAYSLLEPLEKLGKLNFCHVNKLTALAEYRNGGFLVDMGVLKLREANQRNGMICAQEKGNLVPTFASNSEEIIEWRALTVALIDKLAEELRKKVGCTEDQLSLAKILEAGTWKAGREIAKECRSSSGGGPPIATISDGTLF